MATIKTVNSEQQQIMRDEICALLGISIERYYQIQFDTAEQFMLDKTFNDHLLVTEFLKEPIFWNWWRNQYWMIDMLFMVNPFESNLGSILEQEYIQAHLQIKAYPDKVIWQKIEAGYEKAIQQILNTYKNGSEVSAKS